MTVEERIEMINLFLEAGFAAPEEEGREFFDWKREAAFCHAIEG